MPIDYACVDIQKRTAVSLRLPQHIISTVEAYSAHNDVSKTDAYIHFLELGIAAAAKNSDASSLDAAEEMLRGALQSIADYKSEKS